MATTYANQSFGSVTGSRLSVLLPVYSSGKTYYLHHSGNDTYAGIDRLKPFATLAAAHTAMAAGDTLRVLSGHLETLTASQSFNKARIRVLGEGSGSSRPRFTANGAINMFATAADDIWFENLYFPASLSAPTSRISVDNARCQINGCYFECGASDTNRAVRLTLNADGTIVANTSFTSTATVVTAQPARGIEVVSTPDAVVLDAVTFDGGTVGWSSYAFDCTGGSTVNLLMGWNVSLLNSSRMYFPATAVGGAYWLHFTSASMSSYLEVA